jgi:N-acetyl-anhydromuramyl-L-alanine amidase AmpD
LTHTMQQKDETAQEKAKAAHEKDTIARQALADLTWIAGIQLETLRQIPSDSPMFPRVVADVADETNDKVSDSLNQFARIVNDKENVNTPKMILWHSALKEGDVSRADLTRLAKDRGLSTIAFHYVVRMSGKVEEGRPEAWIGAHAGVIELNRSSIGICFSGDARANPLKKEQREAGLKLTRKLMQQYGISAEKVKGHSEIQPLSLCPGTYMDMKVVRERLSEAP